MTEASRLFDAVQKKEPQRPAIRLICARLKAQALIPRMSR